MHYTTDKNNVNGIAFRGVKDRRRVPRSPRIGRINRKYFEDLMKDRKLSLRGLAKLMGLGHSQLSMVFAGTRKLQITELSQLSQIFGQPVHSILENAGVFVQPVGARRARVVGIGHGDGLVSVLGDAATEKVTAPDHLPTRAIAVQMRTAGTDLDFMDGSILFCQEPAGIDPTSIGRLCFVKIKNGPQVVAKVVRGYKDGSFTLSGPYVAEDVMLEWSSPISFTRT